MDNAVKRFRQRRDARLRKRMDEEGWITIKGTHVMIDDKGQVSKGPESLKNVVSKSGGYKAGTKKSTAKPSAGETVHAGGKDWTVESLTQLWKDRGYGPRKAKAQAEKDFNEMKAAQARTKEAGMGAVRSSRNGGSETGGEKESGSWFDYKPLPKVILSGGKPTTEEKRQKKETIDRFMMNAKVGDIYETPGAVKFTLEAGPHGTQLKWLREGGGYSRPVEMSRANVAKFIGGGARKVETEPPKTPARIKEYDDKIKELARNVSSEKAFSDLVEGAAADARLSNKEYEEVYSKALDAYRETAELAGTRPTMRRQESDLRDLLDAVDQDKIGELDFEEKLDRWADKLPAGTVIQMGEEGMDTYQIMKKMPDGKFRGRDKYGDYDMPTREFTERLSATMNHTGWVNDWDNEGVRLYAGKAEEGVSSSSKGESSSASNVGSSLSSAIDELKEDMRANKGTLRMEPKKKAIAAITSAVSSAPVGTKLSFSNRKGDSERDNKIEKIGDNKWRDSFTRNGKEIVNEVDDEHVMHTVLGDTVRRWRSKSPFLKVTGGK